MLTLNSIDQLVRKVGWASTLVDKLVSKVVPTTFAAAVDECPGNWINRYLAGQWKVCWALCNGIANKCVRISHYHYYYSGMPGFCEDNKYSCLSTPCPNGWNSECVNA